ncbi:MAG: hypothetical protein JXB05_26750 [Myxococcaceae bacterium]|nr:hypothetical protein [Myxococcaceae bacterium]
MPLPRLLLVLAAVGLVLYAPAARAVDLPQQMTFQGRLVRADSTPETAPQSLRFALYATLTGGGPLWEESHPVVNVSNGYYSVVLGNTVPLPAAVLNGQALYLGVSLVGQSELTPRLPVVSVPYALLANDSNRLQGRPAADFALAAHSHTSVPLAENSNNLQGRPAADFALATHSHTSVPLAENSNNLQGRPASDFADAGHGHTAATTTANGFMAAADKVKLNSQPSSYGPSLSLNAGTLNAAFAGSGGNFGTLNTVARSNHTHPAPATPTLACTYRTATGNTDAGRNSTAWCATTEFLTGGGCSDLGGATAGEGITFSPTNTTPAPVDSSTPTGGPGYACRLPAAGTFAVPTAYAICCRITP